VENAVAILAVLAGGGLVTALVAVFKARAERKKVLAETQKAEADAAANAMKAISEAAATLVSPLSARLGDVRERLALVEQGFRDCEERDKIRVEEMVRMRVDYEQEIAQLRRELDDHLKL